MLFQLARGVITLEKVENRSISLSERRLIFGQWYERAKPFLRAEKTFDDYLFEFLTSFDGVRHLLDEDVVDEAWVRANTAPLPKVAECFETQSVRLLVGLCRELQRIAGHQPFLLACRTVARLFGHATHTTAASWLRGLASARIIEVVEQGSAQTNRASRYRYIEPLDD
ncbi:MAG: hypothetical protein H0U60_11485 [Blastocatellia bacterium]|nr:hypothetical protein [Blastocatellia bacterium]